jgi:hypothetical protein
VLATIDTPKTTAQRGFYPNARRFERTGLVIAGTTPVSATKNSLCPVNTLWQVGANA